MTDIAVVVNTAALGVQSGDVLSSGGIAHRQRIALLESTLHRLMGDPWVTEIVVAGEWRQPIPTERWKYAECPSLNYDCTDALQQRETGAQQTTSELLVFLHDDHLPAPDFFPLLSLHAKEDRDVNVWVPTRKCHREDGEIVLENGAPNYVMGHCCAMRRSMWEKAPWNHVPPVFTWDIGHTFLLKERGGKILFTTDLVVYDEETLLGATPWR